MIKATTPSPALRRFVRYYADNRIDLPAADVQPVPARTGCALEFTFGTPYEIRRNSRPHVEAARPIAIIGPQTHRRVELVLRGRVYTFVILFQPTGLWELFAVPAETLVDQHYEACAVVGSTVSRLRDQLAGTKSFLERVRVTDNFLLGLCPSRKPVDDIAAAARRLLLTGGCARVSDMARATGLSPRQFERRFRTYVGVPPKLYARIARFEAALNLKAVSRLNTWTEIAHQLGYYDQMHMVHDFQQFSGDVPTRIASQLAMFVDGPTQIGDVLLVAESASRKSDVEN